MLEVYLTKMSSMVPPAASTSLPLSVRLLAPRGGSAAMVAAAVWRWRWQIGGSVAGREAAAQQRRQLSFSLAAAVEAQRRWRLWRQCGGGGSSAVAAASASSVAMVPAAWCWQQQCSGVMVTVTVAVAVAAMATLMAWMVTATAQQRQQWRGWQRQWR